MRFLNAIEMSKMAAVKEQKAFYSNVAHQFIKKLVDYLEVFFKMQVFIYQFKFVRMILFWRIRGVWRKRDIVNWLHMKQKKSKCLISSNCLNI